MITFPSITPSSVTWRYERNTIRNESIGNLITRISRSGDRWMASVVMPPLQGDDARTFIAFLEKASAFDEEILFPFTPPEFTGPSDLTATVDGASQTGKTLNVATNKNSTLIAREGDRIQLADYQVITLAANATTDGTGDVALSLVQPIRTSPDNASAVEFVNPVGKFLLGTDMSEHSLSPPLTYSVSFQLVEAL